MRRLLPVLLLAAAPARAEVPVPAYPDCGLTDDLAGCPYEAGRWPLWGHTPADIADRVRPEEVPLGIGNNTLGAWRLTTGRWDESVAVLDSGIRWASRDIVRKVRLHVPELPLPRDGAMTLAVHDADGNGVVNIDDYANDPRVPWDGGDARADDMLDPSDLIAAFSDGVDDDGNGWVDDIAGWDFFEDDNNPYATNETGYGDHGTGVAETAAGEANGGGGDIGICPNCSILPLRVGDSFISTGTRIGEAIVFAADHGAASIAMALGGMTENPLVRNAVRYAQDRGVVLVGASGDETSFHRNYPAAEPGILYVHSIGSDGDEPEFSSTFLRFINCNNFGPRTDLVATVDRVCATGAVATVAGAAALMQSAAVERYGQRLPSSRIASILRATATDIDVIESRVPPVDPDLYPSYPGWDSFFGWGRLDVGAAVELIASGRLPPSATLRGPAPFSFIDARDFDRAEPESPPGLVIDGVIEPGSAGVSWTLEWGLGTDVEAWLPLGAGTAADPIDGPLGELVIGRTVRAVSTPGGCGGDPTVAHEVVADPLADAGFDASYQAPPIPSGSTVTSRYADLDRYGVTVRLRVVDESGLADEARIYLHIRRDDTLQPGFPVHLPGSFESSPALADIDGEPGWEIVLGGSDGAVHVIDGSGVELPGWPQRVGRVATLDPAISGNRLGSAAYASGAVDGDVRQDIVGSVAAGVLDGTGEISIVAASMRGEVWAWHADGSVRSGFPRFTDEAFCEPEERDDLHRTDCGVFASPVLADLDGDGANDIVVAAMDQHVYAWNGAGEDLPGFPAFVQAVDFPDAEARVGRIVSSPAVGDLDGDGDLEVVVGTAQTPGNDLAGYGLLYVLDHLGAVLPDWPITLFAGYAGALPFIGEGVPSSPVLADLDGDGDLEIAANAIGSPGGIFHHDGSEAVHLRPIQSAFGAGTNSSEPSALMMVGNSSFADVDGDGVADLLGAGSGIGYGFNILAFARRYEHEHLVLAYQGGGEAAGDSVEGFPRVIEDMAFFGSPTAVDLDGDGDSEVIFGAHSVIRAWDEDGREPWGSFPYFHGGWQMGATAVGDLDGDGWREVVAATRDGYVFAWDVPSPADAGAAWPMFRHDARRTGDLSTEIPRQEGPPQPGEPDGGGACPDDDGAAAALLLPLLGRRRLRGR